jgi:hypothetical protein
MRARFNIIQDSLGGAPSPVSTAWSAQKTGKGNIKQVQFGSFERPLPYLLPIPDAGTP